MTITTVADWLKILRESRLIEPDQLEECSRLQATFPEPRVLAKELLRRGWLTPYQVNLLFQGRGAELLLEPYVVLERLGEGGMGQVFKARHRLMDRTVAIKIIRKEKLTVPAVADRFLREIKATAQLSHPNIVTAYDAAQVGETLLFAMEYVEGTDLAQLVKQVGPLPVEQACEYLRQAALGLQHAHERNLVHRDIKPANLLVNFREGVVKVLDLGLARLMQTLHEGETAGNLTHSETVMGTPDFIAPEQARNPHQVDIRADLYSLGCSLYFLLSGKAPFAGAAITEKLLKHQLEEPPPIEQQRPDVPVALARIVRKLLAKQPQERYQTPLEVAIALEPFVQVKRSPLQPEAIRSNTTPTLAQVLPARRTGIATVAETPTDQLPVTSLLHVPLAFLRKLSNRKRWRMPFTRQKRWIWGGIALLCFALFMLVVYLMPSSRSPLQRLTPEDIPPAERFSWHPPELVAVLGEHNRRHWKAVTAVAVSPDSQLLATCAGDDTSIYLWDAATRQERGILRGHGERILHLAFAPDSRRLASASFDHTAKLWDVLSRKEITTLHGHKDVVTCVAFTPDGRTLATGSSDRTIRLWDVLTTNFQANLEGHKGTVSALAIAADGKTLVAGVNGTPASVQVWDLPARTPRNLIPGPTGEGRIYSVVLTTDGKTLAFSHSNDVITLWDLARQAQLATINQFGASGLAFFPDGQTLASSGRIGLHSESQGNVRLWDVANASDKGGLPTETKQVHTLALYPGGRTLVGGSIDGGLPIWDLINRKERPPVQHPGIAMRSVAFTPDGTQLASCRDDGTVFLWDLASRKNRIPHKVHREGVYAVAVSPDGKWLASGGQDVTMKIWDVATTQIQETVHGVSRGIQNIAFSADGKFLLIADGNRTEVREINQLTIRPKVQMPDGYTALAPDGKTVAIGRNTELKLWDSVTGKERLTLQGNASVNAVAYRGDGRLLAAGYYHRDSGNYSVKLLELPAGKESRSLSGIRDMIRTLAFRPDGRLLAAGCANGQVILWDPLSGTKQLEWQLRGQILGLAFAPDGRYLATANSSGTVYLFRLPDSLTIKP